MENLYERVVALLGTTKQDELFRQFVKDCHEEPAVDRKSAISNLRFQFHGVNLFYLNDHHCFYVAEFRLGETKPMSDKLRLPFDLLCNDSRSDVLRKLGLPPMKFPTKQLTDEYEHGTFLFTFSYNQIGLLNYLSVLYRGDFPTF